MSRDEYKYSVWSQITNMIQFRLDEEAGQQEKPMTIQPEQHQPIQVHTQQQQQQQQPQPQHQQPQPIGVQPKQLKPMPVQPLNLQPMPAQLQQHHPISVPSQPQKQITNLKLPLVQPPQPQLQTRDVKSNSPKQMERPKEPQSQLMPGESEIQKPKFLEFQPSQLSTEKSNLLSRKFNSPLF